MGQAAATICVDRFLEMLRSEAGLIGALRLLSPLAGPAIPDLLDRQILGSNVGYELLEKTVGAKYPSVHVYCDKVSNTMREKFRSFSGTVQLTAEIRVSQDRLEGIEDTLKQYTDAMTTVLDQNRGDWAPGVQFTGGYEISYQPVKHGGKNFLQTAKINLAVNVSM